MFTPNRILAAIATLALMGAVSAAPSRAETYLYDSMNRLTSVDYGNGNVIQYTYDQAGNRLTETITGTGGVVLDPHVVAQPLSVPLVQGGDVRVAWNDFGGPVDVSIWKGPVQWADISLGAADNGETTIGTTGWEPRADYRAHAHLASNASVEAFSGYFSVLAPDSLSGDCQIGGCDTPGYGYGVAALGEYAYLASFSAGMYVVSIADPANPLIAGSVAIPEIAYDVAVRWPYAYVVDLNSGLSVVDVNDPHAPTRLLRRVIPNVGYAAEIDGDYLYAVGEYKMVVLSLANPAVPDSVSQWLGNGFKDVDVQGGYAYLVSASAGLVIVDVGNPAAPVAAGTLSVPGGAWSVAVGAGYAYVGDGNGGLHVVDIGDPANPQDLGTVDLPTKAVDLAVSGNCVMAADQTSGLQIVDVTIPQSPRILVAAQTSNSQGVVTAGDVIYLADGEVGLTIFDRSCLVGVVASFEVLPATGPVPLDAQFLASYSSTIDTWVWDFGDGTGGSSPAEIHEYAIPGTYDVSLRVSNAFQADSVSVQSAVVARHAVTQGNGAFHFDGFGEYLRVPDDASLDLDSDWTIECWHRPYTPLESDKLRVLVSKGYNATNSKQYLVGWRNDTSGLGYAGLYVLISSNGADSGSRTALWPYTFEVGQEYYVAVRYVQAAGEVEVYVNGVSQGVRGGYLTSVYDGPGDLQIGAQGGANCYCGMIDEVRVSNVARSGDAFSQHYTTRSPLAVDAETVSLWHLDGDAGSVGKVKNEVASPALDVVAIGDPLAASGYSDIPSAVEEVPVVTYALHTSAPNPFNPYTSIRYDLPRDSRVRLRVFDVAGRLVRTLLDENKQAGLHSVTWDGRDNAGQRAASGIYFCRMEAGEYMGTTRMCLVK